MIRFVDISEAEPHLSRLVDQALTGDEIIISRNGIALAKLVALPNRGKRRKPSNTMRITYIAPDFDDPDPEIERLFYGEE